MLPKVNNSKLGKYFLFFSIPALTVLISAKQPVSKWEVLILLASMGLQGMIAVKALQSDPNASDEQKSNNMPGNGKHDPPAATPEVTAWPTAQ